MKHPTIPARARPEHFAGLFEIFPDELVDQAVRSTRLIGPPRQCSVPRRAVAWLLIAAGLLGRASFGAAWRSLRDFNPALQQPTDARLALARQRLGVAPLAYLARHAVRFLATPPNCPTAFYRGLRLVAFDGTTLRMPDTPANAKAFGYAGNQHGASGFPQLRLLALCELGTHALVHWLIKPNRTSEVPMADVLVRHLQPDQLLLLDANFFSFRLWQAVRGRQAHLLARVQKGPLLTPLQTLPDGSALAKIDASTADRLADRDGTVVRVIAYTQNDPQRVHAGKTARLVTSLLDAQAHPARELIELYHQRWEEELAFAELKTRLNDRKVEVRSKSPAGVVQEVHGLLLAHYVVRALMSRAAEPAKVAPTALSFTETLRIVLLRLPGVGCKRGPELARWFAELLQEIGQARLRPRRSRGYPRVVKGGRARFPSKKPGHEGTRLKPFAKHVLIC